MQCQEAARRQETARARCRELKTIWVKLDQPTDTLGYTDSGIAKTRADSHGHRVEISLGQDSGGLCLSCCSDQADKRLHGIPRAASSFLGFGKHCGLRSSLVAAARSEFGRGGRG